jgi:methyl-accepting chemotaxis protein
MRRSLRFKLVGVVAIVLATMAIAATVAIAAAGAAKTDVGAVDGTYMPATRLIGDLHLAVAEYHSDQIAFLAAQTQSAHFASAALMSKHSGEVAVAFEGIGAVDLSAEQKTSLGAVTAAWNAYKAATTNLTTGDAMTELASLQTGSGATAYADLDTSIDSLYDTVAAGADGAASDANSLMALLPIFMMVGCGLALAIGGVLAFVLSGRVVRQIRDVMDTLASISQHCARSLEAGLAAFAGNDLTVTVKASTRPIASYGTDEVGQMAATTNEMLATIQAAVANYERARTNLASALGEVHDAARSVSATSSEVNQAASESGRASSQIAHTIGQVATGASDQARAAGDTSSAVNDLRAVIDSVRQGAAETARSVESQAAAVDQMTRSIRSASRASSDVQGLGAAAGEVATSGAQTVRQTVEGMARI